MRLVGNVEDHGTAVDIADISAVRPLRENVGVVCAKARIELGVESRWWRRTVAFARTRQPPAADLGWPLVVADVDDAVELVVERMPRLKVRGAARHVHEFAVDEPQRVHAARMPPGGIEMGN